MVEMTVGLGLISLVVLGGTSVSQLLSNSTNSASDVQNAYTVATKISERIKYRDLCDTSISLAASANVGAINTTKLLANDSADPVEIEMFIPNIQAGDGTSDRIASDVRLPGDHLRIENLRLFNAYLIDAPTNRYFAHIEMAVQSTRTGRYLPRITVGAIIFQTTGSGAGQSIDSCQGLNVSISEGVCTDMGCTWQTSPPGCRCAYSPYTCPEAGQVPVDLTAPTPVCAQLGNDTPCPAGEYLKTLVIGNRFCAPLPTPSPTPTPTPAAATCPPATLTWTTTGNTCEADYPMTNSGMSAPGTDSTGPTTGQAQFQCLGSPANWALLPMAGSTCDVAATGASCTRFFVSYALLGVNVDKSFCGTYGGPYGFDDSLYGGTPMTGNCPSTTEVYYSLGSDGVDATYNGTSTECPAATGPSPSPTPSNVACYNTSYDCGTATGPSGGATVYGTFAETSAANVSATGNCASQPYVWYWIQQAVLISSPDAANCPGGPLPPLSTWTWKLSDPPNTDTGLDVIQCSGIDQICADAPATVPNCQPCPVGGDPFCSMTCSP